LDFSRAVLDQTEVDGEVISFKEPKDNVPAFSDKGKVGTGNGPKVEFVIDQVDGPTATSKGKKDAISALACATGGLPAGFPDDGYYFKIATNNLCKAKSLPTFLSKKLFTLLLTAKKCNSRISL